MRRIEQYLSGRTKMLHARPGEADARWASDSRLRRHGIAHRAPETFLVILRERDADVRETGPNRSHKGLGAAEI